MRIFLIEDDNLSHLRFGVGTMVQRGCVVGNKIQMG